MTLNSYKKRTFGKKPLVLLFVKLVIISVWILCLPVPGICAHLINVILCSPAKLSGSLIALRVAGCNITSTARFDHIRKLFAACLLECMDDIKNAVALSSTKVVDVNTVFVG